ncbi:MAG: VOC family protein [Chthoniobacterales bacterium]
MRAIEIAFTGIPVTDMKRARAFYEGVLDLEVSGEFMDGAWVEYGLGASTLALASVGEQWKPSDQGTSVAIEVEDFDAAIRKLKVAVIRFPLNRWKHQCVTWEWSRIQMETKSSFTNEKHYD